MIDDEESPVNANTGAYVGGMALIGFAYLLLVILSLIG